MLEKLRPDQLLVEIVNEDMKRGALYNYPPEMVHACKWAKRNGIKVDGFDSDISVLRRGMTEKDNRKMIRKQKMLMKNYTWKDMNKEENLEIIQNIKSAKKLVDPAKERKREQEMARNIKKLMIQQGNVVVLTGCGHLRFFRKIFRSAEFPFIANQLNKRHSKVGLLYGRQVNHVAILYLPHYR